MTDCVLCGWQMDWLSAPFGVYLPEVGTPLRWYPSGPAPAAWSDGVAETTQEVAVVAHWAVAHPLQLRLALGRRDWALKPLFSQPPPVDTAFAVDLASCGKQGGKTTVVKATQVFIAKAFGVEPEWIGLGSVVDAAVTLEYLDPE